MIKVGYFLLLVGLSSSLAKGLLMINQLLDWGYGLRPSYRLSKRNSVGLPHVLRLAVYLKFGRQVEEIAYSLSSSLTAVNLSVNIEELNVTVARHL